jgi:hypothetical protein
MSPVFRGVMLRQGLSGSWRFDKINCIHIQGFTGPCRIPGWDKQQVYKKVWLDEKYCQPVRKCKRGWLYQGCGPERGQMAVTGCAWEGWSSTDDQNAATGFKTAECGKVRGNEVITLWQRVTSTKTRNFNYTAVDTSKLAYHYFHTVMEISCSLPARLDKAC